MFGRKRKPTHDIAVVGDRVLVRYALPEHGYSAFYEHEVLEVPGRNAVAVKVDPLTEHGEPMWVDASRITVLTA